MRTLLALSLLSLAALGAAQTQLSEGHLDLGLGYDADGWDPHIHDDDTGTEYAPDEAYLSYGTAASAARPAGTAYDFIGAAAGATIWRNYTSNVANIPWAGFGFEEIASGTFGSFVQTDPRRDPISGEWIDVNLVGFTAPAGGNASFFQGGGTSPTLWFATSDGLDATDKFISTAGGHEHGSFAFSATGVYTLTFQASAIENGARITSDPYTYTFAVEAQPVPEPATMAALGLGAFALLRRRKRA